MAEALLANMLHSKTKVFSAGVQATSGLPANAMTLRVLAEKGISFTHFQSQGVTLQIIDDATYIFVMTQQHQDFLIRYYPRHQEKIFLLTEWTTQDDLPDPIGGSLQDYQECCEVIQACLEKILPFIKEENS